MTSIPIQWYENSAFDAPALRSPQPCIHGAGCVFTVKDADDKTIPGVCRFVHPGEEGKGRRLFPERTIKDTGPDGDGKIVEPACVRLVGAAGYYERMRLKMPWQAWCALKGLVFTPNTPGVFREPVRRVPIAQLVQEFEKKPGVAIAVTDQSWPVLPTTAKSHRSKGHP